MQSVDILRASEPGNSQNLNGNLNSLVAQEYKNVPFHQEDLTKPSLTEHLAEKLKLPLEVELLSHHCTFKELPCFRQLCFQCLTVPSSHCVHWHLAVSRCCRPTWRAAESLVNTRKPGFLSFRPQGRSRAVT